MGGGAANARALDSGPPSSSTYGGTDDLSVVVEALTATTQSLKEDLARERETNEAFRTSTLKHQRAKRESRDDRSSPDAPDARRSRGSDRPSATARDVSSRPPRSSSACSRSCSSASSSPSRAATPSTPPRATAPTTPTSPFSRRNPPSSGDPTEISRDDWKTRVSTQMWSANQRGARRRSPRANPRTRRSRKRRRRNRRRGVAPTTGRRADSKNDADAATPAANATRDMAMRAEATSADELPVASTGLRETGERDAADAASEVEAEPKAEPKAEAEPRRKRRRKRRWSRRRKRRRRRSRRRRRRQSRRRRRRQSRKRRRRQSRRRRRRQSRKRRRRQSRRRRPRKKDPASSSGASRSAREALERAETISSSLARHESWARKMSMRLDEYDDKLTRQRRPRAETRFRLAPDLIVSPEVKLGVEKVRRWEERAATRLAESRDDPRRRCARRRRSAEAPLSLPEDDDRTPTGDARGAASRSPRVTPRDDSARLGAGRARG